MKVRAKESKLISILLALFIPLDLNITWQQLEVSSLVHQLLNQNMEPGTLLNTQMLWTDHPFNKQHVLKTPVVSPLALSDGTLQLPLHRIRKRQHLAEQSQKNMVGNILGGKERGHVRSGCFCHFLGLGVDQRHVGI